MLSLFKANKKTKDLKSMRLFDDQQVAAAKWLFETLEECELLKTHGKVMILHEEPSTIHLIKDPYVLAKKNKSKYNTYHSLFIEIEHNENGRNNLILSLPQFFDTILTNNMRFPLITSDRRKGYSESYRNEEFKISDELNDNIYLMMSCVINEYIYVMREQIVEAIKIVEDSVVMNLGHAATLKAKEQLLSVLSIPINNASRAYLSVDYTEDERKSIIESINLKSIEVLSEEHYKEFSIINRASNSFREIIASEVNLSEDKSEDKNRESYFFTDEQSEMAARIYGSWRRLKFKLDAAHPKSLYRGKYKAMASRVGL